MQTIIKIVLLLLAAIIAIKLLPLTLAIGCILAAGLAVVTVLGVSAAVVLLGVAIVLAALLSPLWLPVLLMMGVVVLVRRLVRARG